MAMQQTRAKKGRAPGRAEEAAPRGGRQMQRGGGATHEADEVYALVSVLYHALQGGQASQKYVDDAHRGEDEELVEFFEECRDEYASLAERAKSLLLGRAEDEDEPDEDDEEDTEDDEEEDENDDEA